MIVQTLSRTNVLASLLLATLLPATVAAQTYTGEATFPVVNYTETFFPFDPDAGMQIEVTCSGTSSLAFENMVVELSPLSISFDFVSASTNVTGTDPRFCVDSASNFPFQVANVTATANGITGQNSTGALVIDLVFNADGSQLNGTVTLANARPGQGLGQASVSLPAGPETGFLAPPLASLAVTQGWYYTSGQLHRAVDYVAQSGTPVLAADEGWAFTSVHPLLAGSPNGDPNPNFGRFVLVVHDATGLSTLYAHLSSAAPGIQEIPYVPGAIEFNTNYQGQWTRVTRGQLIGYSGATGTQSPHLHFEAADNPQGHYFGHISGKRDPYDINNIAPSYPPAGVNFTACGPDQIWLSSSNVCGAAAGTVNYSETADGDIAGTYGAGPVFELGIGVNTVEGTGNGSDLGNMPFPGAFFDFDIFSIVIPAGRTLTSITLDDWGLQTTAGTVFIRIRPCAQPTSCAYEWSLTGNQPGSTPASIDAQVATVPLDRGEYTINNSGSLVPAGVPYRWTFVVE